MACRNLTPKFKSFREVSKHPRPGNFSRATTSTAVPLWLENVEHVKLIIQDMKSSLEKLKELHKKRLLVTFSKSEEEKIDQEISILTIRWKTEFQTAHNCKESLTSEKENEAVLVKNLKLSLSMEIQALFVEFRKSQNEYFAKLKIQRNFGLTRFDHNDVEAPTLALHQDGEDLILAKNEIENAEQRYHDIQKIEESIEGLSNVFKELNNVVIDQGTILNRIDYNMENVVTSVKKGTITIGKAREYKKSNLATYCIACLVILIFIFLVILIM